MRRFPHCSVFFLVLTAAFSAPALFAQEAPGGEETPAAELFPLALVLEGAEFAGGGGRAWSPDWPPELPPDAFRPRSGEISRAEVERNGLSLVFRFGEGGRVEEFPFMLNGVMAQVNLVYGEASEIAGMTLAFVPEAPENGEPAGDEPVPGNASVPGAAVAPDTSKEPWKLEFLERRDLFPSLVRAFRGDTWYFISLSRGANEIMETWYDESGKAVGAYGFFLAEIGGKRMIREVRDYSNRDSLFGTERHFDSRSFITEISGPGGIYRVLYFREDLPRYWERQSGEREASVSLAGKFALQWDENDFLLRVTSRPSAGESAEDGIDWRYEYILDEKGNWIERREIRMLRVFGLLVPSPGITVKRILEYKEAE